MVIETAIDKIKQLTPEQQEQVLQFVEALEKTNDNHETSTEEVMAGIEQGLREAMNGDILPLSQVWDDWTSDNQASANISVTSRFQQDLEQLTKSDRNPRQGITPFINRLLKGSTPGYPISGDKHQVTKIRLKNNDLNEEDAGYKVIYRETETAIVLLTLYYKSNSNDISNKAIQETIKQIESEES